MVDRNPGQPDRGGGTGSRESSGSVRREALRAAARRPLATRSLVNAPRPDVSETPLPVIADRPSRSVFVSYSRQDIEVVRALVTRLRDSGVAVTWDQDFVGGADFERLIRTAIDSASSVIVVWSRASVLSRYVRDEARLALNSAKLITTHIEGLDLTEVPLGFGHLNAIPIEDTQLVCRSLAQHGVMAGAQGGS
ncbi:MAG: toll/interleukin-1 receptor domain-containing protein [Hyphomicrobiaceae bacterium]